MVQREQPSAALSKSFLRGCLLLLVGERASYGYDLLEGLGRLGLKRIDRGGLYRALRAMEQEGLLCSALEASDVGPERRMYKLTKEGEDWLHAWAEMLRETQWTMRKCLRRYDGLFSVARRDEVSSSYPGGRPLQPNERVAGSSRVQGAGGPVSPIALLGQGWTALTSSQSPNSDADSDSSA